MILVCFQVKPFHITVIQVYISITNAEEAEVKEVYEDLQVLLVKVKVAQSYLTLCDPIDYTVHGILQARILEWVDFSYSMGSFQPRDRTQVSRIAESQGKPKTF